MRCTDPRCADCSGGTSACRRCRLAAYQVDTHTGRCGARDRKALGAAQPSGPAGAAPGAAGAAAGGDAVQPAIVGGRNATRGRCVALARCQRGGPVLPMPAAWVSLIAASVAMAFHAAGWLHSARRCCPASARSILLLQISLDGVIKAPQPPGMAHLRRLAGAPSSGAHGCPCG